MMPVASLPGGHAKGLTMTKKAAVWFCALLFLTPGLALQPVGADAPGERASPRAPTLIYNVFDLQNMSLGLTGDYALAKDIDASATSGWNSGAGFIPVGDGSNPFNGVFDGKGYNITGLSIIRSSQNYVGLFGYESSSAKIINVTLLDVIATGRDFVGGLVGYSNGGSITSCDVTGSVKGRGYVGGLVGYAYCVAISGCCSTGSVGATSVYVGGLVGWCYGGSVSNCYSTSSVSGYSDVGGLVGYFMYESVTYSYSTGSVSGNYVFAGGLVGYTNGGTVTKCYSTSPVSGYAHVGGLVGYSDQGGGISYSYSTGPVNGYQCVGGLVGYVYYPSISNCYSTGSVSGTQGIGGLVGFTMYNRVSNCYSTGTVMGSSDVGGLIGYNYATQVYTSFWDYQTSGYGSSNGGTGKSTDEMMTWSIFKIAGWDSAVAWGIFEGATYPYLKWRYPHALLVTGRAYSDSGGNQLGAGVLVTLVDNFGLSVAHFESRTDYTGQYRQIADRGTILAIITHPAVKANSYGRETSAESFALDIYNKNVLARCAPGKAISVRDIEKGMSIFRAENILPLNFSDKGLALPGAFSLLIGDGTVFETDQNITASGGGNMTFGGRLSPTRDVLLSAASISFNSEFNTTYKLDLNCTGDMIFRELAVLDDLKVISARNFTARDTIRARSFTQLAGSGTTQLSQGSLDVGAGQVSISTVRAAGHMTAGSLSLRTESADLTGFINGSAGQAGADEIELLGNIRIGTHFFNGIDLYKFGPADVAVATEDVLYSVDYEPMNPAAEVLTWSLDTDAAWLSMNAATGVMSGTPANDDVGKYQVKVTAHDGPKSVSKSFALEVLNVNEPPQIQTEDVLSVNEDEPYSVYYTALDVDPTHDTLTWSLESNASWLHLTANRLWGTPSNGDVGTYRVKITVSDGLGGTDLNEFNLAVKNVNDAPQITTTPPTQTLEDSELRVGFTAADVDAGDVLAWSLNTTAGWLSIDSGSGVLSGTPSNREVGSAWVTVTVSDRAGAADSIGFMLTVVNVNDAPEWASVPPDQNITEGDELLLDILATDVDYGDVIRYGISSQPASGLTINPVSGAIRWAKAAAGSFVVNITATDGNATITHALDLTVNKLPPPVVPPANNPPRINPVTVNFTRVGQAFALKLTGSDSDAWDSVNLTFRLVSGPAGLMVSADGSVLWIPAKDQAGMHTVTVSLSDGKNSATSAFTVEVKKPAPAAAGAAGYSEAVLLMMLVIGILIGALAILVMMMRRPPRGAASASPQAFPVAPAYGETGDMSGGARMPPATAPVMAPAPAPEPPKMAQAPAPEALDEPSHVKAGLKDKSEGVEASPDVTDQATKMGQGPQPLPGGRSASGTPPATAEMRDTPSEKSFRP